MLQFKVGDSEDAADVFSTLMGDVVKPSIAGVGDWVWLSPCSDPLLQNLSEGVYVGVDPNEWLRQSAMHRLQEKSLPSLSGKCLDTHRPGVGFVYDHTGLPGTFHQPGVCLKPAPWNGLDRPITWGGRLANRLPSYTREDLGRIVREKKNATPDANGPGTRRQNLPRRPRDVC
jgi:hypothetical protein